MNGIVIGDMNRMGLIGIVAGILTLGSGCVPEDQGTAEDDAGTVEEQTSPDAQGMEESSAPGADTMPASETSAVETEQRRTSEELALRTDSLPGVGPYVTDGSGQALYLLEGEQEGAASCDDACEEEWPPFEVSSGMPEAQGSLQSELVGSVEREGEMIQVTYGGHPLYFYHGDRGPGDTQGQDVTDPWGEWYLVRPDGQPLEGSEEGGA